MEGLNESFDDSTRPSLLLRVRDPRDAPAWGDFLQIYGPLIYSYCRRSLLQESDAADVSQEVMIRVSQALRGFEYDPALGRFRHWLGRIVRNEIARFCKRKSAKGTASHGSSGSEWIEGVAGEAIWDEHFHAALLEAAIGRIESTFEPSTWKAFRAVWIEDRSPESASQELGIPIEKIYVAKSRVLKRLREELLMLCEDVPNVARDH